MTNLIKECERLEAKLKELEAKVKLSEGRLKIVDAFLKRNITSDEIEFNQMIHEMVALALTGHRSVCNINDESSNKPITITIEPTGFIVSEDTEEVEVH